MTIAERRIKKCKLHDAFGKVDVTEIEIETGFSIIASITDKSVDELKRLYSSNDDSEFGLFCNYKKEAISKINKE